MYYIQAWKCHNKPIIYNVYYIYANENKRKKITSTMFHKKLLLTGIIWLF